VSSAKKYFALELKTIFAILFYNIWSSGTEDDRPPNKNGPAYALRENLKRENGHLQP